MATPPRSGPGFRAHRVWSKPAQPSAVAEHRGRVSDTDVSAARLAGLSDPELVEIVALVADNFFTNLLNNVAETDIDFPVVRVAKAA